MASLAAAGVADELERIAALRAQGALTDDEFAALKARVLGTAVASPIKARSVADPISDVWVYLAVAVPLVTAALIAGGVQTKTLAPEHFYLAANLALVFIDYRQLRTAGYRIHSRLLFGGFVLPSLYLLGRAVELRRGYKYAALYLIPLAIMLLLMLGPDGHRSAPGAPVGLGS